MSRPLDVVAALTALARDLTTSPDLDATLGLLADAARDAIPGVDHATAVVLQGAGALHCVPAGDDGSRRLALLADEPEGGPCRQVLDHEPLLRIDHVAGDTRWPRFAAEAGALGIGSYVGVRFGTEAATTGVLAVYGGAVEGLSDDAVRLLELLAAHAGLALEHARRVENLDAALQSRTVIGLALGMTMERLGLDEDTAFSYLTRVSATAQTKLRDVAAQMVEHHRDALVVVPDSPPDGSSD